jgi:hypothetical protein
VPSINELNEFNWSLCPVLQLNVGNDEADLVNLKQDILIMFSFDGMFIDKHSLLFELHGQSIGFPFESVLKIKLNILDIEMPEETQK